MVVQSKGLMEQDEVSLVNMTLMRKSKAVTDSFLLYSARHQSSDVTKAALSLFS